MSARLGAVIGTLYGIVIDRPDPNSLAAFFCLLKLPDHVAE
jgi:hypothetical protein